MKTLNVDGKIDAASFRVFECTRSKMWILISGSFICQHNLQDWRHQIWRKRKCRGKLVIPNWELLVEQHLQIQCWNLSAPEIESNVQFYRTRDFIERAQFDRTANGCNKENRKKPLGTSYNPTTPSSLSFLQNVFSASFSRTNFSTPVYHKHMRCNVRLSVIQREIECSPTGGGSCAPEIIWKIGIP